MGYKGLHVAKKIFSHNMFQQNFMSNVYQLFLA